MFSQAQDLHRILELGRMQGFWDVLGKHMSQLEDSAGGGEVLMAPACYSMLKREPETETPKPESDELP